MSHHIVQRIEIDDNLDVFITGADNNIRPRTPHRWHCTYYSKDKFKTREDIDIDILGAYDSGNFQGGKQNKYTRALQVLRKMPEYRAFDWRNNWDEYKKNEESKQTEYQALLKKALNMRLPREKWAIEHGIVGQAQYMKKRKGALFCRWTLDKTKATTFHFKEDAEDMKRYFTNSDNWKIVRL